ncbi:MAG: hypothetical protein WCP10_12715 [Desulfuromonadales bacterium]
MSKFILVLIITFVLNGCVSRWQDVDTEFGDFGIGTLSSKDDDSQKSAQANDNAILNLQKIQVSGDGTQKVLDADANVTVKLFIDAHETVMAGIAELKASNQKLQADNADLKATTQKALQTAQRSLQMIEEMASRHGTGELTVFFPVGSAAIEKGTMEFDRLVRFADFLSRESRGRKILLLSIGSASSTGNRATNLKLAKKRSEEPLDILDKYLINIPHEFKKVYGTGDMYSPRNAKLKEHQRYQHTRIIALFDLAQAPKVNEPLKP